jgi:hypothetical protein
LEPNVLDGVANLHGKVGLGLSEGLGRVFELKVCAVSLGGFIDELTDDLDVPDGEIDGLLFGVVEDDGSEQRRGGVVHVEDDPLCSADRVQCTPDEVLASRRKNLEVERQ